MKRSETQVIHMGSKAGIIINPVDRCVYEYVGIGWINIRKATEEDYNNIPILEED